MKHAPFTGISKSTVSKLCKEIDERVRDFLERPLTGAWPYLWLDATYLKVRQGGRIVSVVWMGLACLVNVRRCGRTHCRYTGPYYFLLIVPVLVHGLGAMSLGPWAWWALGALILLGSKLIWLVTEWLWGRYTPRR